MEKDDERKIWFSTVELTLRICGGFTAIVLAAYVFARGWNEAATWGAFGDFVGGLLNPFFAFANLILLVTISYQLRAREEAQAEADREEQRKRAQFEIAFGLKHEAIKELTRILNNLPAPFEFMYASYTPYVSQASTDFSKFCDNHSHLFPTHQEAFNAMKSSIERLSTVSRPYDATLNNPNDAELRLRLYRDLVSCYTEDFGFIRPAFIHSVKSSMRDY